MTIDVTAERVVPLPRERVATYAMDWRHDAWGHLPCPFRAMGEDPGRPYRRADPGG
ncbi:hypothetical protein ABZZ80_11625 [Streptomyces sp. NPDC006356]